MKIYKLPNNCLFYKPFNNINLNNYRQKIILEHQKQTSKKNKLNEYIQSHMTYKIIYEWSSYTSSSSSTTSSDSLDSSWVDMKKLL